MSTRFSFRCWLLCICAGFAVSACVQTAPAPTPTSAPAAKTPQAQRREAYLAGVQNQFQSDAFFERTLGVSRTAPGFAAMKQEMSAIYTDPVVVDWLMLNMPNGPDGNVMGEQLGRMMLNGIPRLNDEDGLSMLSAMGELLGRLTPEQCRALGRDKAMGWLVTMMTPDEARRHFKGLHQGLLAELAQRPLRAQPTRPQMTAMLEAVGYKVPGPALSSARAVNECAAGGLMMKGLLDLDGERKSHAITFLLAQFGFNAQANMKNLPAPGAPASPR